MRPIPGRLITYRSSVRPNAMMALRVAILSFGACEKFTHRCLDKSGRRQYGVLSVEGRDDVIHAGWRADWLKGGMTTPYRPKADRGYHQGCVVGSQDKRWRK